MGAPALPPAPLTTPMVEKNSGAPSPVWARWFQQLQSIASKPIGWQTPTLNAGWANVTGYAAQYRKDAQGLVWVQGYVTAAAAGTAFTLPVGYRPAQQKNLACPINDGSSADDIGRLEVGTNGAVGINFITTPGSKISLDCVFLADG